MVMGKLPMKSAHQRVLEFGVRLDKLVLREEMTKEKRQAYIEHLNASLQCGETEIDSHERMTDDELCD